MRVSGIILILIGACIAGASDKNVIPAADTDLKRNPCMGLKEHYPSGFAQLTELYEHLGRNDDPKLRQAQLEKWKRQEQRVLQVQLSSATRQYHNQIVQLNGYLGLMPHEVTTGSHTSRIDPAQSLEEQVICAPARRRSALLTKYEKEAKAKGETLPPRLRREVADRSLMPASTKRDIDNANKRVIALQACMQGIQDRVGEPSQFLQNFDPLFSTRRKKKPMGGFVYELTNQNSGGEIPAEPVPLHAATVCALMQEQLVWRIDENQYDMREPKTVKTENPSGIVLPPTSPSGNVQTVFGTMAGGMK